jgi:aminocarboxymuconate-semialdehyde decarboxylase
VIIDAHAHVIVPEISRAAAPQEGWRPQVYRDENGAQVVELDGRPIRSALGEFVDVGTILAAQDAAGVDRIVLCPWVPLLWYDAEPADALRRARIQNDALAELVRAHPERIAALGTVPLQNPAVAVRELQRLMEEGTLSGIELAASVRGAYLGDERFELFWAAAERTGALVFIHPTTRGFDAEAFREYYLWNTVGNPFETTITAAHMVMAGVMERHPRLRVLLGHGGGAILALRGRLRHAHGFQPQARARLSESPDDSLRRFYYDSLTHDPELLRALVEFAGPERVLLGSDYPFDMGDERAADGVRAAGLGPDAEEAILGGNAARLLGRWGAGGRERNPREEMIG